MLQGQRRPEKLKLREKSSIFEWVWTNTLTEINFVFRQILNHERIRVKRKDDGNDAIVGTSIVSSHYTQLDFESILELRAQRFRDDLQYDGPVIFVRDDALGTITLHELDEFKRLLYRANPHLNYRILLLSGLNDYTEKINAFPIKATGQPDAGDNVIHRVYSFDSYLQYFEECIHNMMLPHYRG
jgi:hypothetical protein